MVSALQTWLGIGGLIGTITLALALRHSGLSHVTTEIFAWFREFWNNFVTVTPKYLKVLLFLFFILTFGGFVVGGVLNFVYLCDSNQTLRDYKYSVVGGVAGSLASIWIGYEEGSYSCTGWRQYGCSSFESELECTYFANIPTNPYICYWDSGTCKNNNTINWAGKCDFMDLNQTTCNLLGCQYISESVDWDNFVNSRTIPATEYDRDTPEGMFYPECQHTEPVLTFHGINLFSFRVWILIVFIVAFFSLALKVRSMKH